MFLKGITRGLLAIAMVAVGLVATAAELDAVQLWAGGPYWATVNLGAEKPEDYGILTNFNDAAQAVTNALGAGWRMPTKEDFEALFSNCDHKWDTQNNVVGRLFTSKSDSSKSIFFPAAGYFSNNQVQNVGVHGFYWTSTVRDGSTAYALSFNKDKGSVGAGGMYFYFGFSIRAVKDPPSVKVDKVESVEPWVSRKGTIKVEYTLGDVDAKTDYKVAFDVTAGGQTASVTNDATKLTNKQYSQELDTASAALFGKQVTDTKAKVKVSLIATKAKEVVAIDDAEFWLGPPPVAYLDCDGEKMTNAVCTVYEVVTNEMSVFDAATTYVVTNDVTVSIRITVNGTPHSPTRLILCDGAKLMVDGGIGVASDKVLVICGQANGTGALEATGGENAAGIGGGAYGTGGMVTINGGTVTATGGDGAAGIGGGKNATNHGTVIFAGKTLVVAAGADAASAAYLTTTAFAADHSAKYAHMEPGCMLKIPTAMTGCSCVVSNLTAGAEAEIAPVETVSGGVNYALSAGMKVGIYAVPADGYKVVGEPYVIEEVSTETTLHDLALPKVYAVQTAVPQVITYHGVLMRQGGFAEKQTVLSLTFSLYEGATNKVPVWARTIPVSVAQNGSFYIELKDDAGSVPSGVDRTTKLVDALAAMRETPEIGLTPPGVGEIAPRQKLEMGVRAVRAAKARAADEVVCKNGIELESAYVGELKAGQLMVAEGFDVGAKCTFSGTGDRSVGGGEAIVTVAGVKPEASATDVSAPFQGAYTTDNAPCDMALTYASEKDGAFSVIVPRGGKVVNKTGGSAANVVSGTLFAK